MSLIARSLSLTVGGRQQRRASNRERDVWRLPLKAYTGFGTLTSMVWQGSRRYAFLMKPILLKRHRFPPDIIRRAVWLYARFMLSFRDVEDMLAE